MAYYGLSFGAADLPGDVYVNNVINGAVEYRVFKCYLSSQILSKVIKNYKLNSTPQKIAAYLITFFLLNVLGRRFLTAGPLILSGILMIGGMMLKEFVGGPIATEAFRF